jgi:hypothetical protein
MKTFSKISEDLQLVNQSNETHEAKQEEEKQEPNPSKDFRGWAIWDDKSDANYKHNYKHFAMPEFKTFRDLDRFLHVWRRGLEGIEKREGLEKAELNELSSLWVLAGWTVLANAYENFAEGSDGWFKDFAETKGVFPFDKRFMKFMEILKEKQKPFEYPSEKNTEISSWLAELNKWADQFRQP